MGFVEDLRREVAREQAPGLPPDLVELQVVAREREYDAAYPGRTERVLRLAETPVGVLVTAAQDTAQEVLVDVAVTAAARGRGVARAAIADWLACCDEAGHAAVLTVTADNPARRLYRRLGFVETVRDDGWRLVLRRPAVPVDLEGKR
jgi:ribosomal protein S18 acetylase RimI-like enzyme